MERGDPTQQLLLFILVCKFESSFNSYKISRRKESIPIEFEKILRILESVRFFLWKSKAISKYEYASRCRNFRG